MEKHIEQFTQVADESVEKTEVEPTFREQYEKQVEILLQLGIIEKLETKGMGIKGINGRDYPLPSFEDVESRLEAREDIVKIKQEQGFNKLLLVPFGMSLDKLVDKYKQCILKHYAQGDLHVAKKDAKDEGEEAVLANVNSEKPLWVWDKYQEADVKGKMVYQPKEFSETSHGGKTKAQILASLGGLGGWRIILVEDMPNIPTENGQTKAGRTQIDVKGSTISQYVEKGKNEPNMREFLKALQDPMYKGEEGLTPEDSLMYAISCLEGEKGQLIDAYEDNGNISGQLGAYFPESNVVPVNYFTRDFGGRGSLNGTVPGDRDGKIGVRTLVRI